MKRIITNKVKEFYAVVYRKSDPYPIRHICKLTDIKRDESHFFEWYYGEFYSYDDDTVEFFDTLDDVIKFEHKLRDEH